MDVKHFDLYSTIERELSEFPHFLQFVLLKKLRDKRCQKILQLLQQEQNDEYESTDAIQRDNFISLLQFRLGKPKDALEANSSIRQQFPNNITSAINYIYMKISTGYEMQAKKTIYELKRKAESSESETTASIAEHAYCLSRIGPRHYTKAIEMFESAIAKCQDNYEWKYGLALTCRRCLSLSTGVVMQSAEDLTRLCDVAVTNITDIINNCSMPALKARAYVELGDLYRLQKDSVLPLTKEIVQELKPPVLKMTVLECFQKALDIKGSDKDSYILSRCGHAMRFHCPQRKYKATLEKCHELLQKAYKIRPTSYVCHKLANVLIKMVEAEKTTGIQSNYNLKTRTAARMQPEGATYASENPQGASKEEDQAQSKTLRACEDALETVHIEEDFRKRKFKKHFNSPQQVNRLPEDHPKVCDAICYLKQSIAMSNEENNNAKYRLGMLYRQLNNNHEAEEQFRSIISDNESSFLERTTSYEQLGFCLLDESENQGYEEEKRKQLCEESKLMMLRAVEHASKLVSEVPTMSTDEHECWASLPLLKQILANDPNNIKNIQHLAGLCELVSDHKDSLKFYQQLDKAQPNDPEILYKIIEKYIRLNDFQNATGCLRLLLCTSEGRQMVCTYPDIIYQTFLGNARILLKNQETDEYKHDIRDCLQRCFIHKHKTSSGGEDDDCTRFDVFVLNDSDDTDSVAEDLADWLKRSCGLAVTRNSESVTPAAGQPEFSGKIEAITQSQCLVIVLGKTDSRKLIFCISTACSGDTLPKLIVSVLTRPRVLPKTLAGGRCFEYYRSADEPRCPDDGFLPCFMSLLDLDYRTFPWLD